MHFRIRSTTEKAKVDRRDLLTKLAELHISITSLSEKITDHGRWLNRVENSQPEQLLVVLPNNPFADPDTRYIPLTPPPYPDAYTPPSRSRSPFSQATEKPLRGLDYYNHNTIQELSAELHELRADFKEAKVLLNRLLEQGFIKNSFSQPKKYTKKSMLPFREQVEEELRVVENQFTLLEQNSQKVFKGEKARRHREWLEARARL